MTEFEVLVGKKVIAVSVQDDVAYLVLESGRVAVLTLEGDCCSSSSFTPEGMAAFNELIGATITAVEQRGNESPEWQRREEACAARHPPSDVDSWHFLVFITDRGHVTIDWRNSSNGYYDGSITPSSQTLHPVVVDAILEGQAGAFVNALQTRLRDKEFFSGPLTVTP